MLIEIAGAVCKRYLGHYGVVIVSLFGGLVSSASTTAAIALLAEHGETSPYIAAVATVVTSIASAVSNPPVIYRITSDAKMTRGLAARTGVVVLTGAVALVIQLKLM